MLLQYDSGLFLTFLFFCIFLYSYRWPYHYLYEKDAQSVCAERSRGFLFAWSLGPALDIFRSFPQTDVKTAGFFLNVYFHPWLCCNNLTIRGDPVRMSSTYVQSEAEERAKIAIFAAFDEKPPESGFLKTYSVTNCFKIESDKG